MKTQVYRHLQNDQTHCGERHSSAEDGTIQDTALARVPFTYLNQDITLVRTNLGVWGGLAAFAVLRMGLGPHHGSHSHSAAESSKLKPCADG